jgi:hypothetical protein
LSTRRRLIAAFSPVLAAFLAALAFQIVALQRMERAFVSMKKYEELTFLALQLEDAVRAQYSHAATMAAGEAGRLVAYEEERCERATPDFGPSQTLVFEIELLSISDKVHTASAAR